MAFYGEVPHLGLKAKERFLEMAKDLATGITGLVLSQLSFITKLVQKKPQPFMKTIRVTLPF
ncbi:hypothetical protein A8M45_28375 [Escherichia coli]|nr:hypothetical protein A8M45_28375 [Escherichia coli]